MRKMRWNCLGGILLIALAGCSAQPTARQNTPAAVHTPSQSTQAAPTAASTPVNAASPSSSPTPAPFPLSEPGPHAVGRHTLTVRDESRNGREIYAAIYYPAILPEDSDGDAMVLDAEPDPGRAPYPVILTGVNSGSYLFRSHLASYGFVTVIVRSPGFSYTAPWNNAVIDAPLDFLFILDELTTHPPAGLEGILDTDRVGVGGYSSDGLFSLALGGARINPVYYVSRCAQAHDMDPPLEPYLIQYFCSLSERWDEFSSQVGADIATGSEGLWQPTTDDRILVVMPMAPDSAWLYGAEGLAAIDIPSLMIAGTADVLSSYELATCYTYAHLVNSDRVLISFIDRGHMMVETEEVIRRINHFAVAFFGYYLQGRDAYADYFSEDFVAQFDDLAWGIYPGD